MLIAAVEEGIEGLLRDVLPLQAEHGDISFEAPSSTWSATVNRLTVNLFLYRISRSSQPGRVQEPQRGPEGVRRRFPLPMLRLSFLVSTWAGSARDEHELLGDVLIRFLTHPVLPDRYLTEALASNVQLAVEDDDQNRPRDIWSGVGGPLKASFTMHATVAAEAYPYELAPPLVDRVAASASPIGPQRS